MENKYPILKKYEACFSYDKVTYKQIMDTTNLTLSEIIVFSLLKEMNERNGCEFDEIPLCHDTFGMYDIQEEWLCTWIDIVANIIARRNE